MNILFFQNTFPSYGGVEKVTIILANALIKRGHNVVCVSHVQPNPELAKEQLNPTVKLIKLETGLGKKESIQPLRSIILDYKIDFIINQLAIRYTVAKTLHHAIKGTNCKLLTVHHARPNFNDRMRRSEMDFLQAKGLKKVIKLFKLIAVKVASFISLRLTVHYSNRYITLSHSYIPMARKYLLMPFSKKIIAIHNPSGIKEQDEILLNNKINEIIYVGRIAYPQKMVFRLLDIWEILMPMHPTWKLTIVGDGPDKDNLVSMAETKKLQRINFEGFQDPGPFYKRAKIITLVSAQEGLPMVLIEGMTYGDVPVCFNSFDAIYDIIDDRENGVIVEPPYSDSSFAKKLSEIMEDDYILRSYSFNAKKKSRQFQTDIIIEKWESLFHELKTDY